MSTLVAPLLMVFVPVILMMTGHFLDDRAASRKASDPTTRTPHERAIMTRWVASESNDTDDLEMALEAHYRRAARFQPLAPDAHSLDITRPGGYITSCTIEDSTQRASAS